MISVQVSEGGCSVNGADSAAVRPSDGSQLADSVPTTHAPEQLITRVFVPTAFSFRLST